MKLRDGNLQDNSGEEDYFMDLDNVSAVCTSFIFVYSFTVQKTTSCNTPT